MKLKVCGIRRKEDIHFVNEFSPDYIGFVFAKSSRQVTPEQAAELTAGLKEGIKTVGVFVNEPFESLLHTVKTAGLSVIQLHGEEDASYINLLRKKTDCIIWKAVRVTDQKSIRAADLLPVDALLLDSFSTAAHGGTGKVANWDIIKSTPITKPFFLAGGLNRQNLEQAVTAVHPFGVDLSGGIETNGFKDKEKIKEIVHLVCSLTQKEEAL